MSITMGEPRSAMLSLDADGLRRHAALLRPDTAGRLVTSLSAAAMIAGLIGSLAYLGFSFTAIFVGLQRIGGIVAWMLPPDPQTWDNTRFYFHALGETLGIAFMGTLGAALFAFPLSFLAARNIVPNLIVHILTRRMFDTIRGVDALIWALIWINVVGLGPFAGVLALVTSDFGALGKLFSEAIETADAKPVEGVTSCGGGTFAGVRFGVIPQLLPVVLGQLLYFFESNVRSAAVLGIVGAGGIGLPLSEMIRTDEWQQVSFIIIMMLVTVSVIDLISSRLRLSIIGPAPV